MSAAPDQDAKLAFAKVELAVSRTDSDQPSCAYGVISLAGQFENLIRASSVFASAVLKNDEREALQVIRSMMEKSDLVPAIARPALLALSTCVDKEAWLREMRTCSINREAASRTVEPLIMARNNQQMEMS